MVQIIPAILAVSEEEYKDKLSSVEESGLFENGWVQIDLMDKKFVPNESIRPEVIAKYPTKLNLEAQLMVRYPEDWIDELVKVDVARITFPMEDLEGIEEKIDHIKNHQIQVGLSLNPDTPLEKAWDFISKIDLLLIMSVHPGFGGQEFILETIKKVEEAVNFRLKNNLQFKIEVDGGINPKIAKSLAETGADNLVVGSHLLEGSIEENLEKFWEELSYDA